MRQKSEVSQRTKQVFGPLNRTPDSEPGEECSPAAAPHQSGPADAQSDKQENCTKQNVWDSIAKYLYKVICQGDTSRDYVNLRPLSLSVRSITVDETHLAIMQLEEEANE
jgi:hypothetical protein